MLPAEFVERPTADLEIALHRSDAYTYSVELRYRQPRDAAGIPPVRGETQFDLSKLQLASANITDYSRLLGEMLFHDKEVLNAFRTVRAQSENYNLRIRLFIGPSAPRLHGVRWETLRDPENGFALATNQRVLFSRYMSSFDWRPVTLSSRTQLSALVAVANPANLADYQPNGRALSPIDVEKEAARASLSLQGIRHSAITSGVTLNRITTELQQHGYDILYLVCHGAFIERSARLYLEGEDGKVTAIDGRKLVDRIGELQKRPCLVVLVSCQSAGAGRSGDDGVLASLGPRLAQLGVPAVLAMQDNISMETVDKFMPEFFKSLLACGQVDRAIATARGLIQDRFDSWVPVLFMRLESGRIWREAGFEKGGTGYLRWPTLTRDIMKGVCTPVLGSALLEPLVGSSRELAQEWAKKYSFPMSPSRKDDLPQVAQYVSVIQRDDVLREEFVTEMLKEVTTRYKDVLPEDLKAGVTEGNVDKLSQVLTIIGNRQRQKPSSRDSHKLLASFPFLIYITTNPDNMLVEALKELNRTPQLQLCRWKEVLYDNAGEAVEWPGPTIDEIPNYKPSAQEPLVYSLFGTLEYLDSLVLTEDNYFDYLIGVTTNPHPSTVRKALSATALLFLGFKIDDWDFRALFRNLMRQEGRGKSRGLTHVAVQIDPEEGRIIDPDRARRYLQKYFGDVDIDIYWGSVEDFLAELRTEWNDRYPNSRIP